MGIKQALEGFVNRWLFSEEIEQHEQQVESGIVPRPQPMVSPMNGIGRRRGASAGSKSPLTSIVVVVGSFMATFFVILLLISYVRFSSSAAPTIHGNGQFLDPDAPIVRSKLKAEMGDATDELTSKQFRKWAGVVSTS